MQIAARYCKIDSDNELTPTNIIPDPFQEGVAKVVAESVRNAVKESN